MNYCNYLLPLLDPPVALLFESLLDPVLLSDPVLESLLLSVLESLLLSVLESLLLSEPLLDPLPSPLPLLEPPLSFPSNESAIIFAARCPPVNPNPYP